MKGGVSLSSITPFFISIMKLKINNLIFNTETCSHTRKIRITKEELTPRSYVIKTEQLCHQIHCKDHYFLIVVLEKYTDNQLTSTYSWLQYVSQEELQEFLQLPDYHKPRKPKEPKESTLDKEEQDKETLKEKRHRYYELHKEELKQKAKEYFELHKDKKKEIARKYYQEHKDKWQKYYLNKKEK